MAKSYQEDWDKKYCYPESNVLKNKLKIKDADELHEVERSITSRRLAQLAIKPVKGSFDFEHLQKIHKEIFKDLYDWAGQIRTVNIAKGELFCLPHFIPDMAEDIFKKLGKEKYLIGIPKNKINEKFAYYTGEINALHPFREGNGRTQREFIRELGQVAGYEINFKGISNDEMIQASIDSFNQDYKALEKIYQKAARPYSLEEHYKAALPVIRTGNGPGKLLEGYFNEVKRVQEMLKKAHFKPTDSLVKGILQLDNMLAKKHTLSDVKLLSNQRNDIQENQKETVNEIVQELKQQEMKRSKIIELER